MKQITVNFPAGTELTGRVRYDEGGPIAVFDLSNIISEFREQARTVVATIATSMNYCPQFVYCPISYAKTTV